MLRSFVPAVLFACLPLAAVAQDQKHPLAGVAGLEFPADYYWHQKVEQWEKHAPLLGKKLPALDLGEWRNGKEDLLKQAEGKVLVLDFWATWCGPCIRAIPHNHEMVEKYGKEGMVFLAICGSKNGQDKTDEVIEKHEITYPVARDVNLKSAAALAVQWWPTYVVVDRAGKVRAIGLKPDAVDKVVEALLAEKPGAGKDTGEKSDKADKGQKAEKGNQPKGGGGVIAAEWLEKNPQRDSLLAAITGKPAPALQVTTWANGEATTLDSLRGKVVMLDFWATWCGPCIKSIPHNNELQEKYRDQGLVVLGICHPRGGEKMAATVGEHGMKYLTAFDADGKTIAAYGANSFPDYYFIDRKGVLRIADCNNGDVEKAIAALLAEQ